MLQLTDKGEQVVKLLLEELNEMSPFWIAKQVPRAPLRLVKCTDTKDLPWRVVAAVRADLVAVSPKMTLSRMRINLEWWIAAIEEEAEGEVLN